jgi:hypothetical protein
MQIKGITINPPKPIELVIHRDDQDFVLMCGPVLNYKKFEELCPEPSVPFGVKPGGIRVLKPNDPNYLTAIDKHNNLRMAFLVIESLAVTEDLTWELVDVNDPTTWDKYEEEFETSGLTRHEINQIVATVLRAQGMDDTRLDEARENFSQGQPEEVEE